MSRTKSLIELRPQIPGIKLSDDMTNIERFQNQILRPILKFQHDIIIEYIFNRASKRNDKYEALVAIEKERYLDKMILSNPKIKQELHGMILGQFTTQELKTYFGQENELKRRINTMIRERIVSTL